MAQNPNGSGPWLAFVVGGLIVVVAVIGYFVYAGRQAAPDIARGVNVDVTLPRMPEGPKMPNAPIPVPK